METASIQNPLTSADRLDFWRRAAALYGLAESIDPTVVASSTDAQLVGTAFGALDDAERQELLWAAGTAAAAGVCACAA